MTDYIDIIRAIAWPCACVLVSACVCRAYAHRPRRRRSLVERLMSRNMPREMKREARCECRKKGLLPLEEVR